MMNHVRIPVKEQRHLLTKAKENGGFTWIALAKHLKVNRSMVFLYLSGSKMTRASFLKLCKLAEIQPKQIEHKVVNLTKEKAIVAPPSSHHLANFLGILAGDGHMSPVSYEITISGHSHLDRDFLGGHVMGLFKRLFGLDAFIREYENRMICRVYSKRLVVHLSRRFGLPLGKKKNHLHIPEEVSKNSGFLRAYISGLYDTDGSIYPHHRNSMAIDMSSRDENFREEVAGALQYLDFHPTVNGKNVQLYRKDEIERFFEEIQPHNERHLKKYRTYKKLGFLPKI